MQRVIDPTAETLRALSQDAPADTPIVMVNLLRFRDEAEYPDGSDHAPCSGAEAYARYAAHAVPAVKAAGGEIVFQASAVASPIALPGEDWHQVVLVRYPSIAAFFGMVMAPDYQAEAVHRTAALEDARLICSVDRG